MDKVFSKIRRRVGKKVQIYESLALVFFVAVPLPFTGAGLGVLIAYLFELKFSRSILMIFIGVIVSASVVTIAFLAGHYLLLYHG